MDVVRGQGFESLRGKERDVQFPHLLESATDTALEHMRARFEFLKSRRKNPP